ncbi:MGMT family protein [Salinispira pacifica]
MAMVDVWVEKLGSSWFGVAWCGSDLVATAVEPTREQIIASIEACIPSGAPRRFAMAGGDFASDIVQMLAELEAGDERRKRFSLSADYLPERLRRILTAAAAIPIGCVTSYGNIAHATGTVAREVGRAMATNPLYPIVACHRVVGADFALVGYGGRQDHVALRAKLDRLRAEARGIGERVTLSVDGGELELYPVEWVIRRAEEHFARPARQLSLFS